MGGWIGWVSPGGRRYRAPYGANKKLIQWLQLLRVSPPVVYTKPNLETTTTKYYGRYRITRKSNQLNIATGKIGLCKSSSSSRCASITRLYWEYQVSGKNGTFYILTQNRNMNSQETLSQGSFSRAAFWSQIFSLAFWKDQAPPAPLLWWIPCQIEDTHRWENWIVLLENSEIMHLKFCYRRANISWTWNDSGAVEG